MGDQLMKGHRADIFAPDQANPIESFRIAKPNILRL
jgi:hypothetical protein